MACVRDTGVPMAIPAAPLLLTANGEGVDEAEEEVVRAGTLPYMSVEEEVVVFTPLERLCCDNFSAKSCSYKTNNMMLT